MMNERSHSLNLQSAVQGSQLRKTKLDNVRRIYGSHMAMRLATEEAVLHRPFGHFSMKSIALDTVLGEDTRVGYESFLNRPELGTENIHDELSIKYGV